MQISKDRLRRISYARCLTAAVLLAATFSAYAECDCAEAREKELFKCHDAVFIGTTAADAGPAAANVIVREVFKGRVQHDVVVAGVEGDCDPLSLEANRDYLFHAVGGDAQTGNLLEVWRIPFCSPPLPLDRPRVASRVAQLRRWRWWWRLAVSGWCSSRDERPRFRAARSR